MNCWQVETFWDVGGTAIARRLSYIYWFPLKKQNRSWTTSSKMITNLIGIVTAVAFAIGVGLLFAIEADVPAIASRTQVNVGDILLALAAGAAGTLAFTRGLSGAVIGVMVAVALVPPLVVCGMLLAEGLFAAAFGAFLLPADNVICINLSGVAIFLVQGVRPRSWWEAERAKAATIRAMAIWTVLLALLALILWLTHA